MNIALYAEIKCSVFMAKFYGFVVSLSFIFFIIFIYLFIYLFESLIESFQTHIHIQIVN